MYFYLLNAGPRTVGVVVVLVVGEREQFVSFFSVNYYYWVA